MPVNASLLILAGGLAAIFVIVVREERRRRHMSVPRGRLVSAWSGEERRLHPRIRSEGIVRYHRVDAPKPADRTAPLSDASVGGIAARLPERLPPGLLLECEIVAQHRERIHARGEVRWHKETRRAHPGAPREFLTGIQFNDMAPEDLSRLIAWTHHELRNIRYKERS